MYNGIATHYSSIFLYSQSERNIPMKKEHINILVAITVLFSIFLLGFFIGRKTGTSPITVSAGISDGPTVVTTVPREVTQPEEAVQFPININTASAELLAHLPGIGPVLAQRIVEHRVNHGEYTVIEEIMDVSGISETRFNQIKDYITIGG